jgi:SAM-dependent methyltransferase
MNDEQTVAREYADESRFLVRASAWAGSTGRDAVELMQEAIAEAVPRKALEVGCGPGTQSEWMAHVLGADVVALDQSERMVELTRARGIETLQGDVQDMPFADDSFDLVLAAWMLYHVGDLELGLAEIARVLRPRGRLVAVTNSVRMMQEFRDLVGAGESPLGFNAENGETLLRRHFAEVERRDTEGSKTFSPEEARASLEASIALGSFAVPEIVQPIRVTHAVSVFVASNP